MVDLREKGQAALAYEFVQAIDHLRERGFAVQDAYVVAQGHGRSLNRAKYLARS